MLVILPGESWFRTFMNDDIFFKLIQCVVFHRGIFFMTL